MKKVEAKLTLLFNTDGLKIEIQDKESGNMIAKVNMSDEKDIVALMGRLSSVPCECDVYDSDDIGKTQIIDRLVFEMPKGCEYRKRKEVASAIAIAECNPSEWKPDCYFGSKESFFSKDGKDYARCIIRKYVNKESEEAIKYKEERK